MRLVLHREVHSDVDAIMGYYERVASRELADDFYAELRRFLLDAASRPESFAIRERDLRRVNLHRFPYHFLFRIAGDAVRILVVRHHRRHPSLGIHRR
jgi:plasmid stabilization system protein ParE